LQLRPATLDTYDALAEAAKAPSAPPVHLFPEGEGLAVVNVSGLLVYGNYARKEKRRRECHLHA